MFIYSVLTIIANYWLFSAGFGYEDMITLVIATCTVDNGTWNYVIKTSDKGIQLFLSVKGITLCQQMDYIEEIENIESVLLSKSDITSQKYTNEQQFCE